MTLTAEADDDVAVRKVIFEHDGEVIGEDAEAPYSIDVTISDALNGLQAFTATAVDLTGNEATGGARVVVAIDNRFFGTAPGGDSTYTHILDYFDQITPENAGKWGSIEATRDEMNWTALDTAYNFAKENGLPFKYHTLVWGNQQPGWLANLSPEEQFAELDEFMAAVAERYPDIDMIDVVNEPLHSTPVYKDALGGDGETGWDWVIKAFEMAMGYFPNAILMVNDYNILIMEAFTNSYLPIINLLQERGLIDAIGVQGHFLEQADPEVVATNLTALAGTGLGIYVSEFDINFADDARQAGVFSNLVTTFFDNTSVLGVTAWGHLQGAIWRQDAYLIIKFSAPEGFGPSIIANGDFETDAGSWFSWGDPTPTVATTDSRSLAGIQSLRVSDRAGNNPAAIDLTSQVTPGTSCQAIFWASIDGADSANVNVTKKLRLDRAGHRCRGRLGRDQRSHRDTGVRHGRPRGLGRGRYRRRPARRRRGGAGSDMSIYRFEWFN